MEKSSKTEIKSALILFITAVVWGCAFVAQSVGGELVGPYTYNFIRYLIGGLVLIPVIIFRDKKSISHKPVTKKEKKDLVVAGLICGTILCVATNLQQVSFSLGSTAGNAGFLTACYIIIVPIIGIFFHKKVGINIVISVIIAVVGLYLLCIDGPLKFNAADTCLLLCALAFSFHIITIDNFGGRVDGVRLSSMQFFIAGLLSFIPMIIWDMHMDITQVFGIGRFFVDYHSLIPILYGGIMSCGVAYTCQIIGQKGLNPSVASLIMSLESVFSVLAGLVILGELLTLKETVGCLLLFAAVVLAQINIFKKKETK